MLSDEALSLLQTSSADGLTILPVGKTLELYITTYYGLLSETWTDSAIYYFIVQYLTNSTVQLYFKMALQPLKMLWEN